MRRFPATALLLFALVLPRPADGQSARPDSQASQPAASPFPVRILDRPPTLPRGDSRLDAFVLWARVPESRATVTLVLGGVGISDRLEMGAQLVPVDVAPSVVFTNPSVYATYAFPTGRTTVLAPIVQVVYPLESDDPFFLDVGAILTVNIGTWGEATVAGIYSLDARDDDTGSSLSFQSLSCARPRSSSASSSRAASVCPASTLAST
jgi:hypothetical protein